MSKKKLALFQSVIALLLCLSMLVSTTFAWFTDSVKTGINTIASGVLDVELHHSNAAVTDQQVDTTTALFMDLQGNPILWEPGVVSYENLRVTNAGDLALAYQLSLATANENFVVEPSGAQYGLSQILKVGFVEGGITATDRDGVINSVDAANWTSLSNFMQQGSLLPEGAGEFEQVWGVVVYWQPGEYDNFWNLNNGKQLNEGEVLSIDLGVKLIATQEVYEEDSFGNDYDTTAKKDVFPVFVDANATVTVIPNAQNQTTEEVTLTSGQVSAVVPAGTQLAAGVNQLTMTVTELEGTGSNVVLNAGEKMRSLDVHIEGVDATNTQPITVTLKEVAPTGLNMGNYDLYHVENGVTNKMTLVDTFDAHNQFKYDPATGDITLYMATFSEVALVADKEAKWEGKFDYTWYNASATELSIANADQLAAFGAIVGGMNGQTRDSFAGKTVKLISDIDLGDKESENNSDIIFYPIGYYNSEGTYERTNTAITSGLRNFEGTFDGNGHTISNFYHNTWEMKGDNNYYDATLQYYRDGMGLFGKVYGGTVKNLTVDHFSSDGEYTTTGCIAAYADGATFENIAITNCNPRVYNIGNGGIVGCVGWYAKEADLKTTFKNITVDNSNKISALWGSYDVACGGIVGQYYPTSGQSSAGTPANGGISFENCHISAIMDVYNDVCGNYQYYAYRYTGMLIGSVRENVTIDGHVYPKMDGITAKDCTVHFGTWNDYYYCEIIDNTTASYTHDYQMSRLTEIKAIDGTAITYLDGTTGTVPTSGRANYVIVDYTKGHGTENATCYHFKDGAVWTHDMGGIQTGIDENGDGQDDLKEDKQHIYLEFNNLVTGYGWGVTSKGLTDFKGVEKMDITEGDHEKSVEKFEGKVTELANNKEYKLSDIFAFVDKGVEVKPGALAVAVNNLDENNPVSATIVYDRENWENGTITFTGKGEIKLTIQDYYFCTPTTITVNVTERQPVEKFETKFTGNFLYRVGNQNAVKLDSLFAAKDGAQIGNIAVTIEPVSGTSASGGYTSNDTWTNGTIQFSGTGVVKVTIMDDDTYCIPTVLNLEVVDAWNTTTATNAPYEKNGQKHDVVLLNNVGANSLTVKDGYSFYGNDFTMTFDGDGSYRSAAVSYGFVTVENGGVLDNVNIVCNIFPESYVYTKEMTAGTDGRYPYGYSAVVVEGNSIIANCDIEGARNNIQVGEGNVTIKNTSLKNGSLSNIHIKSTDAYTVTLNNVTTEQNICESKYDTSKKVYGFGILVGTNESASNAKLSLKGKLVQNNWISKAAAEEVSNSYAKTAITEAFGYDAYVNDDQKINTGIVYLNELVATIDDNRVDKETVKYAWQSVTMMTYTGQVYSIVSKNSSDGSSSAGNTEIMPTVIYDDESENIITSKLLNEGIWETKLSVDLDKIAGGSYVFSFDKLKVQKYGKNLDYTVKNADGEDVNKNTTITLNQLTTMRYTLMVSDNQIYNNKGELTDVGVSREMPFVLSATKTSIEPPKFTNAGTATAIRLVDKAGGDWRPAYTVLTGVTVTYWSASEGKVKTVDLPTLYNSGKVSSNVWTYTCDDYTLTITGGQVHSDGTKITPVVSNNTLYFASTNKAFTTGTTSRNIILTYVFTDKNASTTWNRTETVAYSNLSEYDYSKFKKGTLEAPSSGGISPCVTPDTLVTLADGTQKRIDQVTYTDRLLAWDFFKGEYTAVSPAIIFDHGIDNNTVIKLNFSDGTTVKAVNLHQFFDADLNQFVSISADTVADYVGHKFTKKNGDTYEKVTLVDYTVSQEYVEAWGIISAMHYNIIVEGMISTDFMREDYDLFNYFEVGDNMMFDQTKMRSDIEKYGLYTYEEFAEYLTYEQFAAFNVPYFKVAVGKGRYTFEGILNLIATYLNN